MEEPRLRKANYKLDVPYNFEDIPDSVLKTLAKLSVYRKAVGQEDISGNDFGDMFAEAIEGEHYSSPVGIVDVASGSCGWSVKTIKRSDPHSATSTRLISGRNSPDYSYGISDPRADVAKTGEAVLSIWNHRVEESLQRFIQLRTVVLIRNFNELSFLIYEKETVSFPPEDYIWSVNNRGNFEGRDVATDEHRFVWQPSGSQFTIIDSVPDSARPFHISRSVEALDIDDLLSLIDYDDSWVICGDEAASWEWDIDGE